MVKNLIGEEIKSDDDMKDQIKLIQALNTLISDLSHSASTLDVIAEFKENFVHDKDYILSIVQNLEVFLLEEKHKLVLLKQK